MPGRLTLSRTDADRIARHLDYAAQVLAGDDRQFCVARACAIRQTLAKLKKITTKQTLS